MTFRDWLHEPRGMHGLRSEYIDMYFEGNYHMAKKYMESAYNTGRADALREAAEVCQLVSDSWQEAAYNDACADCIAEIQHLEQGYEHND